MASVALPRGWVWFRRLCFVLFRDETLETEAQNRRLTSAMELEIHIRAPLKPRRGTQGGRIEDSPADLLLVVNRLRPPRRTCASCSRESGNLVFLS